MPGKCKFQDAWLSKDIYRDWLLKDPLDIHLARCKACGRAIKLQTMGEAALTSHAGGSGHKKAVHKLLEGNVMMIMGEQVNGDRGLNQDEDNKDAVTMCLQRDALDRMTGSEWSDLHHSPDANSISHNPEFQGFPTSYINSSGTSRVINHRLHPTMTGCGPEAAAAPHRPSRSDPVDVVELDQLEQQQQKSEVLEPQEQMKILEWENRMKVLEWEQELLREKRRAARQKEKAFRMKKRYYKAKLKRMGEDVTPSSSSSGDEEEKAADHTG